MDPELIEACGTNPKYACEWVLNQTSNQTLATLTNWFIDRPLRIVFIVVLALALHVFVRRMIDRSVERFVQAKSRDSDFIQVARARAGFSSRTAGDKAAAEIAERTSQRAHTVAVVLKSAASALILTTAALLVLGEMNLNLGPLIAGAGIAGIAIGFGAQSVVKDVLAGMFILLEDQFGVGDIVDLGPAVGEVEQISLRATRIRDVYGTLWVVSNGEIQRVGNHSQLWARSVLDLEIAYDTDVDFAIGVIQRVADEAYAAQIEDATIVEPPVVLGVQSLGADSVVIRLAVKTEASEQFAVSRYLNKAIKETFEKEGIIIPFPQRTVWVQPSDPGQPSPSGSK